MKRYEVQYLDQQAPGATFMVILRAKNPFKAYVALKTLGYKPIRIKEFMGGF